MNNINIRTIKTTDYIGRPSPMEMASLESRHRRRRTLAGLTEKIAELKQECQVEQAKENPNVKYIAARMRKINLMQNTLENCR